MIKSTTQMKRATNILYVSRLMIQIEFRRIENFATGNTDFASSAWNSFLTYD
jgi:hypothetical protein